MVAKILTTLLNTLSGSLKIADFHGGTLRNAIPREAKALCQQQKRQHSAQYTQHRCCQNPRHSTTG